MKEFLKIEQNAVTMGFSFDVPQDSKLSVVDLNRANELAHNAAFNYLKKKVVLLKGAKKAASKKKAAPKKKIALLKGAKKAAPKKKVPAKAKTKPKTSFTAVEKRRIARLAKAGKKCGEIGKAIGVPHFKIMHYCRAQGIKLKK